MDVVSSPQRTRSRGLIGPIELILVRHGESVRNHGSDLAHHGDPSLLERQMRDEQDEAKWPLTEMGHAQAAKTGTWIHQHLGDSFDAAYVSPFLRTIQTADDLCLPVRWQVDDRIREREWGDYAAPGEPPYLVDQYLTDLTRCSELDWKTPFPGGESVLDMVPRVTEFLEDVWRRTPRGRIVAVTHGGTIRAMQTVLEQLCVGPNCPDHRLSNCCVVMYHLEAIDLDQWVWNGQVRTAHPVLPGEPETEWERVGGQTK